MTAPAFAILTLCIFYRTRIPYSRPVACMKGNTKAEKRKVQIMNDMT